MIPYVDIVLVLLSITGFMIAAYINRKKHRHEHMVCYIGSSCEEVVHSPFSKFFGVPVEVLGMLYYGVIGISYALLFLFPHLASPLASFALMGLSAAALLFSMYLTFIQVVTLKELCTWCLTSALLCLTIFATSIMGLDHDFMTFLADYKYLMVTLHTLTMAIGVGAATVTDVFFFRFLKDFRISRMEADILNSLSQIIWAALIFAVLSGIALYLPQADELNHAPKFLVKAIIVAVILVNGAFLNLFVAPRLSRLSFKPDHSHKTHAMVRFRKMAFALGAVSLTSWYSALILGSLRNVPLSFWVILGIYLALLIAAVKTSQVMERRYASLASPDAQS